MSEASPEAPQYSCESEIVASISVARNHGWRHTLKTIGREAGIEDSVLDAICGHAPSSVGGAYGGVSIAARAGL